MSQIVSHRPTDSHCGEPVCRPTRAHWRRLVKNIGWANQNTVESKGGKK